MAYTPDELERMKISLGIEKTAKKKRIKKVKAVDADYTKKSFEEILIVKNIKDSKYMAKSYSRIEYDTIERLAQGCYKGFDLPCKFIHNNYTATRVAPSHFAAIKTSEWELFCELMDMLYEYEASVKRDGDVLTVMV